MDRSLKATIVRNWVLSLAAILSVYLVGLLILLRDRTWPIAWKLEEWWQRGGFCQIGAVVLGFLILQLLAGGYLNVRQLRKTSAWLALVPCLLAGNCAGKAYQGARALGWIGESTERSLATAHKLSYDTGEWVRTGDGGGEFEGRTEYRLIVRERCCGEWELRDGTLLTGYEIPVSKEVYLHHRVGSTVSIVDLPGEPYPSHRLSVNVETEIPSYAIGVALWTGLALVAVLKMRKQLVMLELQNVEEQEFNRPTPGLKRTPDGAA